MTDGVRRVDVAPSVRALSTLARVDYADSFLVDVGSRLDHDAEQLAREIMEGVSERMRSQLLAGWSAIGLKIGRSSGPSLLGWQVRRSAPDHLLVGADSRIGMPGELLFKKDSGAVLFATFVQQSNLLARAVWAATEPVHVRIVRDLMADASRRLRA
jgi:hypothetical protein